jgi:cytochrome c oxidase subunit 4
MSEHHDNDFTHHVVPPGILFAVFFALLILMGLTIFVAYIPLGNFNLPIALTIAIVKATLIMLFFMEVKYGSKLLWVFAGSSFVFLLIMLTMTMNDYLTRQWVHIGP